MATSETMLICTFLYQFKKCFSSSNEMVTETYITVQ